MKRFALLSLLVLAACATTPAQHTPSWYDDLPSFTAASYDESRDAEADFAAALARAQAADKHLLAIFGADWCHDSRGIAGLLETPRFAPLVAREFEVVFIDVGTPQREGEARNLDIPARYGVTGITGTPTVLAIAPDGRLVNGDTAREWRSVTGWSEDEVYARLQALAAR